MFTFDIKIDNLTLKPCLKHHRGHNEEFRNGRTTNKILRRIPRGAVMVHKDIIERRADKGQPRGKPFQKGHSVRKPRSENVVDKGHSGSIEREAIAPIPPKQYVDLNPESTILMEENQQNSEVIINNDTKILDTMDFYNEKNKLSIKLILSKNRTVRVQMFLNEETEIRNMTYHGIKTGMTFWNLLKGTLRK